MRETGRRDWRGGERSNANEGEVTERQGTSKGASESEGEKERAAKIGKERVRVNVRDLGLEFRKILYL